MRLAMLWQRQPQKFSPLDLLAISLAGKIGWKKWRSDGIRSALKLAASPRSRNF
jgi:hypothetical protein